MNLLSNRTFHSSADPRLFHKVVIARQTLSHHIPLAHSIPGGTIHIAQPDTAALILLADPRENTVDNVSSRV